MRRFWYFLTFYLFWVCLLAVHVPAGAQSITGSKRKAEERLRPASPETSDDEDSWAPPPGNQGVGSSSTSDSDGGTGGGGTGGGYSEEDARIPVQPPEEHAMVVDEERRKRKRGKGKAPICDIVERATQRKAPRHERNAAAKVGFFTPGSKQSQSAKCVESLTPKERQEWLEAHKKQQEAAADKELDRKDDKGRKVYGLDAVLKRRMAEQQMSDPDHHE